MNAAGQRSRDARLGIRSVGGENFRPGEEAFRSNVGGRARGKEWADAGSAARRSAPGRQELGGAKECAGHQRDTTGVWCCLAVRNWEGGEFHALGLCPRHPKQQTQPFFFVQAIDDIGLTIQSIHRLKECVADPPEWESQQKNIPGRANQKR